MRLFQNLDIYPQYLEDRRRTLSIASHASVSDLLVSDRFFAVHMLEPVLQGSDDAAFAIGRDEASQRDWARSQGMSRRAGRHEILLAQIEHHRTEVFYNLDAMRFASDFVKALPGCVKRTIAWRAGPSGRTDFGAYDLIVCNFASLLQSYRDRGWRAAWFYPSFDPVMSDYAASTEREWDVVFIGSYSRHHGKRSSIVQAIADLAERHTVKIGLQRSLLTRVADRFPALPLLGPHAVPSSISRVAAGPVYGLDLYRLFAGAKIVVNGAIDMSGPDRGNMRCWEALGCRALMLSDHGTYPEGFVCGETMRTYASAEDLVDQVALLLADGEARDRIANAGHAMVRSRYSKARQWADFQRLAA